MVFKRILEIKGKKLLNDLKEHIRQKESGELSVTASTDIKQENVFYVV